MTIRVNVELMPGLGRVKKENVFVLDLPVSTTLKAMLLKTGFKEEEIEHLRVFVNERIVPLNKPLKNGDNVWVGIVLGGGGGGFS